MKATLTIALLASAIAAPAAAYNRDGSPTSIITEEHRTSVVAHFALPGRVPQPFADTALEIALVASAALQMLTCGATWRGELKELLGTPHLRQPVVIKPHPFDGAEYHPKDACMSVEEVTEWAMPANNAISFTAKFKSPESGEITRMWFEMTRNSRGEWLFTRLRTKA